MAKSVRRDLHKMHAFVRFRRIEADGDERFVAWFEPDHFILEATAGFFVERFRALHWSILTPIGAIHWDRKRPPLRTAGPPRGCAHRRSLRGRLAGLLREHLQPGAAEPRRHPRPHGEEVLEEPARDCRDPGAGPNRAASRVREMIEREAAMPAHRNPTKAVAAMMTDQEPRTLDELNRLIAAADPMVEGGTRAVLGEGPVGAAIAFVGEQPGDQEDLQGRPFVGPAGQLLDRALAEVGIDRSKAYVTNAVKHFKYVQRGKRRLHQRPTAGEVTHYRWWLKKELDLVGPRLVVALGATAVLALAGKPLPITANRGETRFDNRLGYITVHPSYLLRLPDEADKQEAYAAFRGDLARIREIAEAA